LFFERPVGTTTPDAGKITAAIGLKHDPFFGQLEIIYPIVSDILIHQLKLTALNAFGNGKFSFRQRFAKIHSSGTTVYLGKGVASKRAKAAFSVDVIAIAGNAQISVYTNIVGGIPIQGRASESLLHQFGAKLTFKDPRFHGVVPDKQIGFKPNSLRQAHAF
jgi:hypothetical protein